MIRERCGRKHHATWLSLQPLIYVIRDIHIRIYCRTMIIYFRFLAINSVLLLSNGGGRIVITSIGLGLSVDGRGRRVEAVESIVKDPGELERTSV